MKVELFSDKFIPILMNISNVIDSHQIYYNEHNKSITNHSLIVSNINSMK